MKKSVLIWIVLQCFTVFAIGQQVLIVADEIPAMEVLAKALSTQEKMESKIVLQSEMPGSLADFEAVVVYIHRDLDPGPEKAFIEYTRNGGKLICLHHSISSAKRKNESWFSFLGLDLPKGEAEQGGYKFIGDIDMTVVNLAPKHFITTNKISYDTMIPYFREGHKKAKKVPGFVLYKTEAFLNHYLHSDMPRTIFLGMTMKDKNGKIWAQDRSAWYMRSGKGWVFYSQPGHAVSDFENPVYVRMVLNMIVFDPDKSKN